MSAEQELYQAYEEWRRLSEAEGEAVRAGQWILVLECQNALKELKARIVQCTEAARMEWAALGFDRAAQEDRFRPIVNELIDIQLRNQCDLETQRRLADAESGEIEATGRNLQRVRRSYTAARPATWTVLS